MWHKCEYEFLFKPKGFLESDKSFQSAMREFFLSKGYTLDQVACGDEECNLFTIEPVPEIIKESEAKVIKIPKK